MFGTLSHITILLAVIQTAWATQGQQLRPLHRHLWYKQGHPIPSWYHAPGHTGKGCRKGKGCHWGDGDCYGNGTQPGVEVELQEDEQMLWASPNATDIAVVSIIVTPYPGQQILDMERFSGDIATANCSENMVITFSQRSTFEQAWRTWDWVNQGDQRSFVLVGDPVVCNSGDDRDPWLIVRMTADPSSLTINLQAIKKEWSQVTYQYEIDFGTVGTNPTSQKRYIPFAWDKAFQASLNTTFPSSLAPFHVSDEENYVDFQLNCVDCGLSGSILFEGHIHGGVFPLSLNRFELTMTPIGVQAVVNLEFLFSGSYKQGMYGLPDVKKDFDLLGIPLPFSWHIKGIFELGPEIRLQAGFALESLQGNARLTTGFTVTVPDDSALGLNLMHLDPSDSGDLVLFYGWAPNFEAKKPTLEAQVTAVLKVYFQMSPSFDIIAFGQRGVTAGFPFKFLDLSLTITSGSDPNGFCPGDPSPNGIRIEPALDIELDAEVIQRTSSAKLGPFSVSEKKPVQLFDPAETTKLTLQKPAKVLEFPKKYEELRPAARSLRHRDHAVTRRDTTLISEPLIDIPNVSTFEPWCLALPGEGCPFQPEPEDQEWFDAEVAGADEMPLKRTTLFARARKPLKFTCGGQTMDVVIKPYPGPTRLKGMTPEVVGVSVPIMRPLIGCKDRICPVANWGVVPETNPNKVVVPNDPMYGQWSNDHIYEANWIIKYWEYLNVNKQLSCSDLVKKTLKLGRVGEYADQLLSNIGNDKTFQNMMALYPGLENSRKHRIFAKENPDKKFFKNILPSAKFNVNNGACSMGRVISVCKYMAQPEIKMRLENTLRAIDQTLADMDADTSIPHPPDGSTYRDSHKEWFTEFYYQGIEYARSILIGFAEFMITQREFVTLRRDQQTAITRISKLRTNDEWSEFCPRTFDYPTTAPTPGTPSCGDTKTDPKNCGECGKQCPPAQTCTNGVCTASPDKFPPDVVPAPSHFTDWQISFQDPPRFSSNSWQPPTNWFVAHDGKPMINTRCVTVREASELYFDPFDEIPAGLPYVWEDNVGSQAGEEDSCCIAFFPGTTCTASERRVSCENGETPFVVRSFVVYGCGSLLGPRE